MTPPSSRRCWWVSPRAPRSSPTTGGACGAAWFPLIDLELFARPVLRHSALANATTMFGLTGLLFFSAQYLQLVVGYSPLQAGLLLLPGFVVTVVAGLAAARLARRFALHQLVATGLALVLTGYVACLFLQVDSAVVLLMSAAVLIGAGSGCPRPSPTTRSWRPPRRRRPVPPPRSPRPPTRSVRCSAPR